MPSRNPLCFFNGGGLERPNASQSIKVPLHFGVKKIIGFSLVWT